MEIHEFGNASDVAIGAVVYLVNIDSLGVTKSIIQASLDAIIIIIASRSLHLLNQTLTAPIKKIEGVDTNIGAVSSSSVGQTSEKYVKQSRDWHDSS